MAYVPGGGSGSGTDYRDCTTVTFVLSTFMAGFDEWAGTSTDIETTDSFAWQTCYRVDDGAEVGWVTGLPGVPQAEVELVDVLVEHARATIVIDLPDVDTSPPEVGTQLVGVPVWFWLNNHQPVSVTASIPTLSATLTATPGDMRVELGDGTVFTCDDGGVPYDPSRSYRDQATDCSRAYDHHGSYTVRVSVVWALAWSATNGQSGTLPSVTRTTTFGFDVQQGQAVTT